MAKVKSLMMDLQEEFYDKQFKDSVSAQVGAGAFNLLLEILG